MSEKVSVSGIARMLGVRREKVSVWISRSSRNGFPRPVDRLPHGTPGVPGYRSATRVWDADAVRAWHESYVPSKGGRPKVASRSST
jgi:hypothetical protein